MSQGDKFHFYVYNSDDGNPYTVKLSDVIAALGGFTQSANNDPLAQAPWAYHARHLRHITAVSTTGQRCRVPCGANTSSLYANAGTFTLRGNSYTVLGTEGERRPATNLA